MSNNAKPFIVRRKEKRKQQSSPLLEYFLDSSSPELLIDLAVRVDELHGSKSVLLEPLESGRLYDNAEMFLEALQFLRDFQSGSRRPPPYAVTPVIVSGLLSCTFQKPEEKISATTTTPTVTNNTLSPDLVSRCQSMRTAALYRLRARERRYRQLSVVLASGFVVSLAVLWHRTFTYWHARAFAATACDNMPAYAAACRLAEAAVWWQQQSGVHPVKLETTLERDTIVWESGDPLKDYTIRKSKRVTDADSISYQLVKEAIHRFSTTSEQRVLDVGSGIGGLSYALSNFLGLFHGVSASSLEIGTARENAQGNAEFYQQSFDRPFLLSNYTVAVAIDSLSFSRHLQNTITHVVSSLESGGLLIVMDDVVHPVEVDLDEDSFSSLSTYQPSLVPHSQWMASFAAAGCKVVMACDLSSEYQVQMEQETSFYLHNWNVLRRVLSILLVTIFEQCYITNNPTSQRLLELVHELEELGLYWKNRQSEYEVTSNLYYHMYVCVKK